MTDMREHHLPTDATGTRSAVVLLQQELHNEINRLSRLSTRGIMALSLFLVVCLLAWRGFSFLPAPETVTAHLGKPPSASVISIVLLIYTFSAIVLSLSRMTEGIEHRSSFSHVGYLTCFFLFYYFGKSLEDNYWAVFGAGITILGVESYRIWTYCAEGISKNKQDIEYIARTGRPPPQE
ncbi:MAG: menaquinol oxidoreductase [Desulfuromonadaceae bacterium]|nr:menaquinol oxidoreductase [Desulfuromonadaceae bacterium]MDD5107268.1 menaquinol oxidoreductase [Desulfuromonadaceae bacterium]